MRSSSVVSALVPGVAGAVPPQFAQQGRITDTAGPLEGAHDLTVRLYDHPPVGGDGCDNAAADHHGDATCVFQ